MPTPLSAALKTETTAAHTRAEDSAFVEQLIAGGACAPAFTALVAQQLVFYRAMEDVLHRHYLDDPLVGAVADRKLDRVPALELDMAHHFGRTTTSGWPPVRSGSAPPPRHTPRRSRPPTAPR